MYRFALVLLAILAFTQVASAQVIIITEPVRAKPKAVSYQRLPTGYLWTFSDAQKFKESFAQYAVRTGLKPPESRQTCSTGYCSSFSRYPTIATGGCGCGCNASLCGCHHSPNAGKSLIDQKYEPGRVARNN